MLQLGMIGWAATTNAYNEAITTLNGRANNYLNSKVAKSARSIGSNPLNPSAENLEVWDCGSNKPRKGDNNYLEDYNQLQKLNLINIGTSYWFASRWGTSDNRGKIGLYLWTANGKLIEPNYCGAATCGCVGSEKFGFFFSTNSTGYGYIRCCRSYAWIKTCFCVKTRNFS